MSEDKQRILTSEEVKAARQWLKARHVKEDCTACGNKGMQIAPEIALLPNYQMGSLVGGGFPAVIVYCTRCLHLRMHSAIAMGFVAPAEDGDAK